MYILTIHEADRCHMSVRADDTLKQGAAKGQCICMASFWACLQVSLRQIPHLAAALLAAADGGIGALLATAGATVTTCTSHCQSDICTKTWCAAGPHGSMSSGSCLHGPCTDHAGMLRAPELVSRTHHRKSESISPHPPVLESMFWPSP